MDHQYRENGGRSIHSNHNQMRADAECSPNQLEKLYLIDLPYGNRRNFEDSAKVLAVSVSEIYQSIAVQLYQPTLIRWLPSLYVYKQTTFV